MCRHVAYVGPPEPIDRIVYEGDHSLVVQAYRPRELLSGVVCADGFGVGWYGEDGHPARYRSAMPIWSDANLPEFGPAVRSRIIVAMVRNATPGMPLGEAVVHPFRHGQWLFIHNGSIRDPLGDFRHELRSETPAGIHPVGTDTSDLFGALMAAIERGEPAEDALIGLIDRVRATGYPAWLNFLLTDGRRVWATRWAQDGPHPSLYLRRAPEAVRLASEPLDDGEWDEVPPATLLTIDRSLGATSTPIGG